MKTETISVDALKYAQGGSWNVTSNYNYIVNGDIPPGMEISFKHGVTINGNIGSHTKIKAKSIAVNGDLGSHGKLESTEGDISLIKGANDCEIISANNVTFEELGSNCKVEAVGAISGKSRGPNCILKASIVRPTLIIVGPVGELEQLKSAGPGVQHDATERGFVFDRAMRDEPNFSRLLSGFQDEGARIYSRGNGTMVIACPRNAPNEHELNERMRRELGACVTAHRAA